MELQKFKCFGRTFAEEAARTWKSRMQMSSICGELHVYNQVRS